MKVSILFIIGLTILFLSCKPEESVEDFNQNNSKDEEKNIEEMVTRKYDPTGNDIADLKSLDVYYKTGFKEAMPVVIWIHGGAWAIGDKAEKIDDKKNFFRANDYIFVSVNYRLSPSPVNLTDDSRIKAPIHAQDVAMAIRWVRENISEFGGNPNELILLGHSAGAHLASLLVTNQSFIETENIPISTIKGVISVDTQGYDSNVLIEQGNELYINAMGNDPSVINSYAPIKNVTLDKSFPNFLLIKRGSAERLKFTDDFGTTLTNAGAKVEIVNASIYTHITVNEAIGKENEGVVTPVILTFINSLFGK